MHVPVWEVAVRFLRPITGQVCNLSVRCKPVSDGIIISFGFNYIERSFMCGRFEEQWWPLMGL